MARSPRRGRSWPDAPILVGSDTTFNPKMNNVRKGLEAASRPVVALCDAGIILDAETLCRAAAPLSDTVGLVLALKAGEAPGNFAAELERAYINGHQARFLLAADRLGIAVASGGVTLMSHETLQRIGNWRGFNRWIADDYSVTRSVRELGLQTRLGDCHAAPAARPARLAGGVVAAGALGAHPAASAGLAARPVGAGDRLGRLGCGRPGGPLRPQASAPDVLARRSHRCIPYAWLAAEAWFMAGRGLSFGPRAAAAALVREALAPVLMAECAERPPRSTGAAPISAGNGAATRAGMAPGGPPYDRWRSNEHRDNHAAGAYGFGDGLFRRTNIAGGLDAVARSIIVDGSAVTYMSAAGVRALAGVLHRRRGTGGARRVLPVQRTGGRLPADVSGFSQLLDIAENVEEATARLEPRLGGKYRRALAPARRSRVIKRQAEA